MRRENTQINKIRNKKRGRAQQTPRKSRESIGIT
jgi:hypothetical protein